MKPPVKAGLAAAAAALVAAGGLAAGAAAATSPTPVKVVQPVRSSYVDAAKLCLDPYYRSTAARYDECVDIMADLVAGGVLTTPTTGS